MQKQFILFISFLFLCTLSFSSFAQQEQESKVETKVTKQAPVSKQENILKVTIKLSEMKSTYELHEALEKELSFPYYYGKNWDAFHECLTEKLSDEGKKIHLNFTGIEIFKKRYPQDVQIMLETLNDLKKEHAKLFSFSAK